MYWHVQCREIEVIALWVSLYFTLLNVFFVAHSSLHGSYITLAQNVCFLKKKVIICGLITKGPANICVIVKELVEFLFSHSLFHSLTRSLVLSVYSSWTLEALKHVWVWGEKRGTLSRSVRWSVRGSSWCGHQGLHSHTKGGRKVRWYNHRDTCTSQSCGSWLEFVWLPNWPPPSVGGKG